ncbi:MAG: hypothetical protein RR719_07720 [Akkermansia sp.]
MIKGWALKNQLQQRDSLMEGKLLWNLPFNDSPMEFRVPDASYTFIAIPEVKEKLTPLDMDKLIEMARQEQDNSAFPRLLIVPYLSKSLLERLDRAPRILAADLCGNGILKQSPFYMYISGKSNQFPSPTRVSRPYSKTSALAAMTLLEQKLWQGQQQILERIELRGGKMVKSQLSKLISSYEQDGVIRRKGRSEIIVYNPGRLLDKLHQEWQEPELLDQHDYRFPSDVNWEAIMKNADEKKVKWCFAPQYSLRRYAYLGEGRPMFIWTDNPAFFLEKARLEKTNSPAFSLLNLSFVPSPLGFFQTVKSTDHSVWAGPVMSWIQASRGDARQQETAEQLYADLVNFGYTKLIDFSHA